MDGTRHPTSHCRLNHIAVRVLVCASSFGIAAACAGTNEGSNALSVHERCYGYSYGDKGLPKDYEQARLWCHRSAELGNASGQTLHAELFWKGNGVQQDFATAGHWYRLAAEAGHPHAQMMRGPLYVEGQGVAQDRQTGIAWVQRASSQGYPKAREYLEWLESEGALR